MNKNVAARTNEFVRGTPPNKITLAQATPILVPYMASRPEKLDPTYLGQYQFLGSKRERKRNWCLFYRLLQNTEMRQSDF